MEVQKTKTEFFETEEQRNARRGTLVRDRKRGASVHASRFEVDEWRAFNAAVSGTPWQDVVAGWRAWQMEHHLKQCDVTVQQAVRDALAAARALHQMNKLAADSLRQKVHKLELFAEQFGHLRLNEVQTADVETWIEDFDEVQTEATFNNYRKHVAALFTPYVERGLLRSNPIRRIKKRDDSTDKVGILTVQETAHLFNFALQSKRYKPAIGRLALEAFLGLRFSSGCRLEKQDINFEDRGILLPKRKLKTKKRHYIDNLPSQLWDWLAVTPEECWRLSAREYMQLKSGLFVEAGVPHPHNCFRHSFATYDVAAHKNAGRTAYLLCHRNQDLLYDHYRGNATEAQGKAYQSITPETAARMAEGYVPLRSPAPPAASPQSEPGPGG